MTCVKPDDLTEEEKGKLHDYLHEDNEKVEVQIKPVLEKLCFFCKKTNVNYFHCRMFIETIDKGISIKSPVCPNCKKAIDLFFNKKEGVKNDN